MHRANRAPFAPAGGVQEAWVARYNGPANDGDAPRALALDSLGNVYVTGWSWGSGTGADYATVKYNSAGQQQWVARYNSPGNGQDYPNAMAVDDSGNVYVTGFSGVSSHCTTIKYDSAGQEQWVAHYDVPPSGHPSGNAIALDSAGNVYVAATVSEPPYCATIKYDPAGQQQWVSNYHRTEPLGIGVDAVDNVYVAGTTYSCPYDDYVTLKYTPAGQEQWIARYNPGVGYAMAVDGPGNVYVTGNGGVNSYEYATVKYNSAGQQQWVAHHNPGYGFALAVDNSSNVFVTGVIDPDTSPDFGTIKYNASGQEQWVARYNGPAGNGSDFAYAIALDGSGNIYVTGTSQRAAGAESDYATIKYDSAGQQQWVARYNSPGNGQDYPNAIAVDKLGNVYVTGSSGGDFATVKYTQGPPPTPTPARTAEANRPLRAGATVTAPSTPTPTATASKPFGTPSSTPSPTPTPQTCCQHITTTGSGAIVPGTADVGNHCDNCVTPIGFPFPVNFYGSTFTQAYVNSNGSLLFADDDAYFRTSCPLPDPCLPRAILVYQDDLRTDGPGDGVFTSVAGTAPNRVFNIEWRTSYFDGRGSVNFELRFYENQTLFDVIYGATADNGASAESGVQQSAASGPCNSTTFSCHEATLTNGLKVTYQSYPCGGTPPPTPTPPTSTPTPTPTPGECSPSPCFTPTPTLTPTPTPRQTPTPRAYPTPRVRPTPVPRP
jgi:Beta-propeller repeat